MYYPSGTNRPPEINIINTMQHIIRIMCAIALVSSPLIVSAHEVDLSSDLAQSIRAEIMKDPRSGTIPTPELDAMISGLVHAAEEQGVQGGDVATLARADVGAAPVLCDFFCSVNAIFGFGGNDHTIPWGLGITSAILILFISLMLHRHHKHGIEPTIHSIHTHE